ncbi:MAG: chemotaxis protein CheW, partial [Pseudomonadota bacterium]
MMSSLEADPAENQLDEPRDLTLGLLTVGTETVAVDIAALAEVARIETLRPTLEPHPGVLGLISIRGALTPVYDPFGTFAAETGRRPGIAAILHRRGTAIGLAVDGVQGLSRFPA